VSIFKVGDLVSLHVPRIDRGGTDLPRLPAKIIGIKVNKDNQSVNYKLLCDHGIIKHSFAGDNLSPSDIGK
jgi:hypothetical protein